MGLQVWTDEAVGELAGNAVGDRADEEWGWRVLDLASNEGENHEGHQTALSVVHVVLVSHPLCSLTANLVLLSWLPMLWDESGSLPIVLAQVFSYQATLSDDNWLGVALWLDGYDGRFAQGVDFLELWRCELRLWVAVEDLDLIRCVEDFKEPKDALRAGCLEPRNELAMRLSGRR